MLTQILFLINIATVCIACGIIGIKLMRHDLYGGEDNPFSIIVGFIITIAALVNAAKFICFVDMIMTQHTYGTINAYAISFIPASITIIISLIINIVGFIITHIGFKNSYKYWSTINAHCLTLKDDEKEIEKFGKNLDLWTKKQTEFIIITFIGTTLLFLNVIINSCLQLQM